MGLRHKFLQFFKKTFGATQEPSPTDHDDPQQVNGGNWSRAEITALVMYQRRHTRCTVTSCTSERQWQTVILGFDLTNGEILLDEFFPAPPATVIAGEQELSLILTAEQGLMELKLRIVRRIGTGRHASLLAKTHQHALHPCHRTGLSMEFARHLAPRIEFLVPMVPLIKGHISQLSPDGAVLDCYMAEKPKLVTFEGHCSINFDDRFQIDTSAKVHQVHFSRSPYRHCQIHLIFDGLTPEQRNQITAFLTTLERRDSTRAA